MDLIADGVLVLSALVAAAYCMVLSRRLRKLMRTEGGLGEAIAAMSRQADELSRALAAAKSANEDSAARLHAEVAAAREARAHLAAAVEQAEAALRAAEQARAAPHPPPPPADAAPPEAPAREPASPPEPAEAVGPVTPKKRPSAPSGGRRGRSLDGIISAYLDSHSDQDEERVAQRLVAALTGPGETPRRAR